MLPWHKVTELIDKIDQEEAMPWMTDSGAFYQRFGISYEQFCEILINSPEPDKQRYEKIQQADIEAAIVWILEKSTSNASE